jgi:hypothetical protein
MFCNRGYQTDEHFLLRVQRAPEARSMDYRRPS